jgi:H+-transporting ATPase
VIGLLLVIQGAVALYLGAFYYQMDIAHLKSFMLLVLVFTSQFRVLSVRERRHFWSSRPGTDLLIANSCTLLVFFLLGIYGIIIPSLALNQVLVALVLSAGFTFGVDFPKYYVFRKIQL